ncbi:MAG TPA: class I SAM-dependent methyltransferase [Thermoleophilaceae bacterium]|nr:class I SAM-dependent methyltransferase [Thermoleophilaceae bacterium]
MQGIDMRRYWDERAQEDAYYFVDNRLDYGAPDVDRFWAGGEEALSVLLGIAGAEIEPGDVLVDIGCGLGRLTRAAAGRGARVRALDVSGEMLERARQLNHHLEEVEWIHGDGRTLHPIEDASVDCCISIVVFQHIPDPAITLGYVREMGRVLKPGGWAAFQLSTDEAIHRPNQPLRDRMRALVGRAPRGQADPSWVGSGVRVDELRAVAADVDLELARVVEPVTQFTTVLAQRT